ncbi:MAG: hypothetical protein KME29_04710 [Calothrix sp. FI2-JRJ7]|jgi:hypothetical protein|nr:hypothetical protein [Calothrix sp. FI2-JRJ7]
MLKLPFKTTPREFEKVTVGAPEIGELEFPKYGDLSPNERAYLKTLLKDAPDLRASAVRLARKISTKSGTKLTDVYNALVSADSEALGEYLEEFVEFQALMEDNAKQREIALVTSLIRYRLHKEWTIDDTGNPELLPLKLLEAIAEFARNEENGWQEAQPEQQELTEEDLGKSSEENLKNQTGEKSSGASESIGATKPASTKKTSATNQPG